MAYGTALANPLAMITTTNSKIIARGGRFKYA